MRNWLVIVPGAAAAGLLAAACGGSATTAPSSPAASHAAPYPAAQPGSTSPAAAAGVSLHSVSGVPDQVLVAGNGRTLYLFEADQNGKSTCSGACAQAWPPDTVTGTPQAQMGVRQGLLGTTHRSDGTTQVTYNGHPLYFYAGDSGPGSAHGQGSKAFGAGWYAVGASGDKVDTS